MLAGLCVSAVYHVNESNVCILVCLVQRLWVSYCADWNGFFAEISKTIS